MREPDDLAAIADQAASAALAARGATAETIAALPDWLEQVERISLSAIAALLARSGALPAEGPPRRADAIVAGLGTASRHGWLVHRWLSALIRRGWLSRNADGGLGWIVPPAQFGLDPTGLDPAYHALGFPPTMATAHRAALERLGALVRDDITLQHLLFRDGDVLTALAAYQDNLFTAALNAAAAALAARRPRSRLLELGGGAGLTTAAALRALAGSAASYRFTDVSRLFTVAAERRFTGTPGLICAPLNIDEDFAAQGVAQGSVEIVLAGNVLHNARDLGATLGWIHRSLTPNGWLILTDSIRETDAILTSMQFLLSPPQGGSPPGGRDRRPCGQAFLDASGWADQLAAADFTLCLARPNPVSPLAAAGQCLLLAQSAR